MPSALLGVCSFRFLNIKAKLAKFSVQVSHLLYRKEKDLLGKQI